MNRNRKLALSLGAGVAVFLGACAPMSNASADPSSTAPDIVALPADAVPATGTTLADVMDSEWVPQPALHGARVSFTPQHGIEGFTVDGGPCNGYGTVVHPNVDTGTFTTTPAPVTRMACDSMEYEGAVTAAFNNATAFYTVGADTLYIAGDNGALKLVRAN